MHSLRLILVFCFQLTGDDADVGLQQVVEDQIQVGQGYGPGRAQHPGDRGSTLFVKIVAFDAQFNERFLLNKPYFIILLETFNTNVL